MVGDGDERRSGQVPVFLGKTLSIHLDRIGRTQLDILDASIRQ